MVLRCDIFEGLRARVSIQRNPYGIPPHRLFAMAARKNSKRHFLFVSKVLGKHIPVNPASVLLVGRMLGLRYYEKTHHESPLDIQAISSFLGDGQNPERVYAELENRRLPLPGPVLLVGFAETATGLGHAVFETFADNAAYIHTTRENIPGSPGRIAFQEEHCHAPSHYLYPDRISLTASEAPVVFIDDELTTGKTVLNIIRALHRSYPRRSYGVISILDWRDETSRARFKETEASLGIRIESVSLMEGLLSVEGEVPHTMPIPGVERKAPSRTVIEDIALDGFFPERVSRPSLNGEGLENAVPYLKDTGRFGIHTTDRERTDASVKEAGNYLKRYRTGRKTLCMGTGELMYVPMKIAGHMGGNVFYQSTTRSPIYPCDREGYGARNAFVFQCPEDPTVTNYFYNIPCSAYDDLFVFFERKPEEQALVSLKDQLKKLGIPRIFLVSCSSGTAKAPELGGRKAPRPPSSPAFRPQTLPASMPPSLKASQLQSFPASGSYPPQDVTFLLKDITNALTEQATEEREKAIQSGAHYSEMLPIEYRPSREYMSLFYHSLNRYARKIALAVAVVSEKILAARGEKVVLVSLARAGIPAGILVRRYLESRHGLQVPHYGISIIRGKGFDENAVGHVLEKHPDMAVQFVDGWTGKGSITKELVESCARFEKTRGVRLSPFMAVIADPGHCASLFGTREDFLIPSACLNATVSGLVSRTVHRRDLVGPGDFHGVKFYRELSGEDVSTLFVDTIAGEFPSIASEVEAFLRSLQDTAPGISWSGMNDVGRIQRDFCIENIHFIKPGIGETTRVLLRRIPWKVLVHPGAEHLEHILQLAEEKGVPVEPYPLSAYRCCGLIKPLNE